MQISKCNVISGYGEFLPLIFALHFRRKSSSVALEEEFEDAKGAIRIHQLISYFSRLLFIQSIYKMEKKRQQNFATGNAIYLLPRTIIQIANDNSIFRKEGIFWLHARYERKLFILGSQ